MTVSSPYNLDVSRVFLPGDTIQIQNGSQATVSSVTSPNIISLSSSVFWGANKGVWFRINGASMPVGAFEPAGTNLTINASTNIMVIGSGGNLTVNGAVQTNNVLATDGTGTTTLIGTPFTMTVGTYTY